MLKMRRVCVCTCMSMKERYKPVYDLLLVFKSSRKGMYAKKHVFTAPNALARKGAKGKELKFFLQWLK